MTGFDREALIRAALDYQVHSYAPYSHFNVAAAVLMDNGKIFCGANVENAAYSAGICAERNAIFQAVAEDKTTKIAAIAIVGGHDYTVTDYCAPCGVCRQVMREFCLPQRMRVLLAKSPEDYLEKTLDELLPLSFGPEQLGKD